MQIPRRGVLGKYSVRPAACLLCNSASWWNGSRKVSTVCLLEGEVKYQSEMVRRRACCSRKECPQKGWTVYEDAQSYPHRLFSLSVVVSAVSAVVLSKQTLTAAAGAHQCGRDSVRRWEKWVGELADPAELMRACTRLEASGLPGAGVTSQMPKAAAVLHLLDRFWELMTLRAVKLPFEGCGLISVLKDQLARFGQVFYLTKSSPRLRADISAVRI